MPVILFSSLIMALALMLTIFGFYAYLKVKEEKMQLDYRATIYDLNARLFAKYIPITIQAKIETEDTFRDKPVAEGTITNSSNKKIYSLKLKLIFYDKNDRVLYVDTFYPIGVEFESLLDIADITDETKNFLAEGNSISFTHKLTNCPDSVCEFLEAKLKFAKSQEAEPIRLEYKIEGLDIR